MKLIRLAGAAAVYFCVATVLAQLVWLGVMFSKGTISPEKMYQMLAVVHEVRDYPTDEDLQQQQSGPPTPQVGLDAIDEQRLLASADLTLRETAVDKGLRDLLNTRTRLQTDINRFKDVKATFQNTIDSLEKVKDDEGLQQLQRTLEALSPKQSKDEIMNLIKDGQVDDVVAIISGMSMEKRKKILAEFKTPQEMDSRHEVLKLMRGKIVEDIGATRDEMNRQFDPSR